MSSYSQILTEDLLEEAIQPVTPVLNQLGYFGAVHAWWTLSELYSYIPVPVFSSIYLNLPQISVLTLMQLYPFRQRIPVYSSPDMRKLIHKPIHPISFEQ